MIPIAAAAATVTVVPPFSPLEASGVVDEPELWPPFDRRGVVAGAEVRRSPSRSCSGRSCPCPRRRCPILPSAPAELAAACVSFDEEPSAVKLTLPPAVRFALQLRVDEVVRRRRAPSERPMPALAPFVAPFAFVVAFAVWVACAVRLAADGQAGRERPDRGARRDVRDRDRDLRRESHAAAARGRAALGGRAIVSVRSR